MPVCTDGRQTWFIRQPRTQGAPWFSHSAVLALRSVFFLHCGLAAITVLFSPSVKPSAKRSPAAFLCSARAGYSVASLVGLRQPHYRWTTGSPCSQHHQGRPRPEPLEKHRA